METADQTLLAGMRREKNEEIGSSAVVQVLPNETYNLLFRKKDGNAMVIPHIPAIYVSGDIQLNEEYSDYKWVPINELDVFEPKIESITILTMWAKQKLATPEIKLVTI